MRRIILFSILKSTQKASPNTLCYKEVGQKITSRFEKVSERKVDDNRLFSLIEAKNAANALALVSIFNEE